jgi:uncharacterized membrane protein YkvA (DUF1232 family)
MKSLFKDFESRAGALKSETHALYFALRDPRTPWTAKALLFFVLAYALSPIDLIPDFIPVFGYLDDLIIVPAGIALALKAIPSNVMGEAHQQAAQHVGQSIIMSRVGMSIILLIWILAAIWIIRQVYPLLSKISR